MKIAERAQTVEMVMDLLREAGAQRYGGEAVSQQEHALQCALQAEAEHARDELVVAALLHDFGHLMHQYGDDAALRGLDDKHEVRALHLLRRVFGAAVLEPIRLHVAAKRYLCSADPGYYEALSPASRLSLSLQGGPFTHDEAAQFLRQPHAFEATRLRTWDDHAKTPGAATHTLQYYQPLLERCAL
jgi:phosphonate degradation associated HDIG domain protein